MASPELAVVLELLKANPPIRGDDVPSMRASMDALLGQAPPPDDVEVTSVDAGGVPAEWVCTRGSDSGRAIVYFHGGAYVMGGLATHRNLVAHIARRTGARVLGVDYRLAPEHPFPAAVDDAVSAYRYVLASGRSPDEIALAGDSAGGGLTAAALIALRDAGEARPGAGVCISPWLDLTLSFPSWESRADADPLLFRSQIETCAAAYLGDADPRSATISPVFADLRDLPPILVQIGTAEVLLDESLEFGRRAGAAGVDVEVDVAQDMIHVWHAFADLLPEARDAIDRLAKFLDARLA